MRNFHGFKKIAADHKSTTFAHPNGSKLTVAHASLDPKTLKHISSLPTHKYAEGGEAPVSMPDPQKARDAWQGALKGETLSEGWQNLKNEFGYGKKKAQNSHSLVQNYAGDENKPENSEVTLPDLSNIDPSGPAPAIPAQLAGAGAMAPSSDYLANPAGAGISANPVMDAIKYGKQWLTAPGGTTPEFKPSADEAAAPAEPPPTNVSLQSPQQSPGGSGLPMPDASKLTQGLEMQMKGNTNEANAIADREKANAAAIQKSQKDMEDLNYQTQQNAWNNKVETQNMIEDMKNGHIDPNAYINRMGTGEKVGTAIGLILGGLMGGDMSVGMSFLNKQIDRDIEAQKSNIENKKTIFNAMQTQFRNDKDATDMTRAFYLSKLQNEMATAAAKSGSPIAAARAQQANGPLQMQIDQIHAQVGMRQAALNAGGKTDPAVLVPYLVPKEQQAKVFEEIKNAADVKALTPQILAAFDRGSSRNPVEAAQGQKEFEGLINTTVKEQEGTVRQAAMDSIHRTMTPSGLLAMPGENESKRRTIMEYLAAKRSAPVAKAHHIDLEKFDSTAAVKGSGFKKR